MISIYMVVCALLAITAFVVADVPGDQKELVQNPEFAPGAEGGLPDQWTPWKPVWAPATCPMRALPDGGLLFEAPGRPYAVGGVSQDIPGIQGGQAYVVKAACEMRDVPFPYQATLVRLEWTRDGERIHPAGLLVRGPTVVGTESTFEHVLVAPQDADGARISLEIRWPQGGQILCKRVSLQAAAMPQSRKVKVGTVYLRPKESTPQRNLELWCEQIDAAGKLGLDIVCLCEAILMIGTGTSPADIAEPIPGPSTERLGKAARANGLWVVAGLMESDGAMLYNTAVLLDREGKLAGTYRKVHLPREEWKQGVTPGHEYPVFETDFGTIAIQVCYDWFFPEPHTIFAQRGAEIIFAPTWGSTFPDDDGMARGETVFRVRARDNGVYMVPSVYDGNSMVIDPLGRILASNKGEAGVFWAEIDLDHRESMPWVGNWRSIGPRDRMPSTYGPLLSGQPQPNY